ncbi:MAG: PhzF family phenazine biosynthesis protein [Acidimicrobiia bacterium]|nr:PhzF family phenazine biosynthesis protein [Acidimicrobiia bacterium]
MSRPCSVLRVFTRDGEGGNHLGVVNDVMGLDPEMMQGIAADLGFSETIFVDWQEPDAATVRIFTPAIEMPFAGHPLVGATWALYMLGPGGVTTLRCLTGDVAIGMEGSAAFIQTVIDPASVEPADLSGYATAAGMPPPVAGWRVAMPRVYSLLQYVDAATVASLQPDMAQLAGSGSETMVFARASDRVRARFFAPAGGVPEDPATGSAAVALAMTRIADGEGGGSLVIDQGEEIGHPSRIMLSWRDDTVRIAGECSHDETRLIEDDTG